ncbi:MAG: hypothetical protein A3K18_08170 [Lentisphaerae bacterium RIFOXYA12_64_32]|nr:MAG: hypothetical protein A3K18_08170 [Lentisphaerae bacterium RIFOXYA12_64_32]
MPTVPVDTEAPTLVTPPPGGSTPPPAAAVRPPSFAFPKAVWVIVLLLAYANFLAWNYAPAIFTPDANGYYAQGTLLANTGKTCFRLDSPVQYVGMHWLLAPSGDYYSRYPPGLAVPIALMSRLFGPEASVALNPILAVLGVLGLFLLVQTELGFAWGMAAAALLAINPTYNLHAISCDSHMAVTALLTWGLWCLLLWSRQGRLWQALCGGLLLGCIPTVRYPEALYGLGIGVFLLWHWRCRPRAWLDILGAGLAALIPIVPLLGRNQVSFGAFWRTAYSFTNEQTGFGWGYFQAHFVQYLQTLLGNGVGLFFPLGVIGITLLCGVRKTRALGCCLALLTVPVTLLYMAYYWAPAMMSQGTMRFLLPTFPLYFLAGLWALHTFLDGLTPARRYAVMAVLMTVQACWGAFTSVVELRLIHHQKRVLAIATQGLEQYVPANAVVAGHPQILQHLDFVRRWRLTDPSLLRGERGPEAQQANADDDTPRPMQAGKRQAQTAKYEGLRPGEREKAFADDVRAWAGEEKVFYIGTEEDIANMQGAWFHPDNFKVIARLPLPEAPKLPNRGGMDGGGPPGGMQGPPGAGPAPDGQGPQPPDQPGMGPGQPDAGPPDGGPDRPAAAGGVGQQDRLFGRAGAQPGGMARGRGGPGGGGGMLARMDFVHGAKELVIAEWHPQFRIPKGFRRDGGPPAPDRPWQQRWRPGRAPDR